MQLKLEDKTKEFELHSKVLQGIYCSEIKIESILRPLELMVTHWTRRVLVRVLKFGRLCGVSIFLTEIHCYASKDISPSNLGVQDKGSQVNLLPFLTMTKFAAKIASKRCRVRGSNTGTYSGERRQRLIPSNVNIYRH